MFAADGLPPGSNRWCSGFWWGVEEGDGKVCAIKRPRIGLRPGSTGRRPTASPHSTSQLGDPTGPSTRFPQTPPTSIPSTLRLVRGKSVYLLSSFPPDTNHCIFAEMLTGGCYSLDIASICISCCRIGRKFLLRLCSCSFEGGQSKKAAGTTVTFQFFKAINEQHPTSDCSTHFLS